MSILQNRKESTVTTGGDQLHTDTVFSSFASAYKYTMVVTIWHTNHSTIVQQTQQERCIETIWAQLRHLLLQSPVTTN